MAALPSFLIALMRFVGAIFSMMVLSSRIFISFGMGFHLCRFAVLTAFVL
jgi:hypothetical protein